jgi:hypothetical protein
MLEGWKGHHKLKAHFRCSSLSKELWHSPTTFLAWRLSLCSISGFALLGLLVCYFTLYGSFQRWHLNPLDHPIGPLLGLYFIWANFHIIPWKRLQRSMDQLFTCAWDTWITSLFKMLKWPWRCWRSLMQILHLDLICLLANMQVLIGLTLFLHHMEIIGTYFAKYVLGLGHLVIVGV